MEINKSMLSPFYVNRTSPSLIYYVVTSPIKLLGANDTELLTLEEGELYSAKDLASIASNLVYGLQEFRADIDSNMIPIQDGLHYYVFKGWRKIFVK